VTAGGGLIRSVGQDAAVTLVNEYAFNPVNFRSALHNAFAEVDRVVLHVRGPRYRPLAIFGIGTSQRLTARSGIDLDVRAGISRPSATVTVDAAPGVALVSDPDLFRSGIMSVSGTPFTFPVLDPITVMLFNSNAETTPRWPSSLSGPAVTAMQTFSGHSLQVNAVFRFGLYYRF
jgi:hypothetical protein